MKTLQEQIAENIEHIFNNTKRIHGNSEALDWIKIAIHRSAEFIYHKYLKAQVEQESNNRQQSEDSANNLKTAKEILKGEMSENLWTFICSYPVSYKSEEKLVEWIIDAMQEYAAQHPIEQENLTIAEKKEINEGYRSLDPLFEGLEQQEKPSEQSAEEILDFQQYITNLLYYAHVEAMDMHSIDFDKWVEREVDNIKDFYASQKHLPTDEEIEKGIRKDFNSQFLRYSAITINDFVKGAKWLRDKIK